MEINSFEDFIATQDMACYCLVDGAYRFDNEDEETQSLLSALYGTTDNHEFFPLYAQTKLCNYLEISPLLIKIDDAEAWFNLIDEQELRDSIIMLSSQFPLKQLVKHFQQFIEVYVVDKLTTFRFYDPIIFNIICHSADQTLFNLITSPLCQASYINLNEGDQPFRLIDRCHHQLIPAITVPITLSHRLYHDLIDHKKQLFKQQLTDYIRSQNTPELLPLATTEHVMDLCEKCSINDDTGAELLATIYLYDRELFEHSGFNNNILLANIPEADKIKQIEDFYNLYQSRSV